MRVLLVNTSELAGGAAVAAGRLLRALGRHGVKAELLVRDKQTSNARVVGIDSPLMRARFALERLDVAVRGGVGRRSLFAVDPATRGADITRLPAFERADVVHLHWVNQGMLSLGGLRRVLLSGKRVVWTLHDMWPMTGICHHADACTGWLTGCGHCPLLGRRGGRDLSARTFERKRQAYGKGQLSVVACSDWLAGLARQAPLFEGCPVRSIANPLDTAHFAPGAQIEARRRLGLPEDKRLVLFVAFKATEPAKGIDHLRRAVQLMTQRDASWRERLAVVVVGREAETLREAFDVACLPQEYVADEQTIVDYYRAADVLAMPTLHDNLPNTVAEASACGLPTVAFAVGGLPQMVDDGATGRLVPAGDDEALAQALADVLGPSADAMRRAARRKAVETYGEEAVVRQYLEVYTAPHLLPTR